MNELPKELKIIDGHRIIYTVAGDTNSFPTGNVLLAQELARRWNHHDELVATLDTLVNMYVANRGTPKDEFISCITPPHASAMTVKQRASNATWLAFDNAQDILNKPKETTK